MFTDKCVILNFLGDGAQGKDKLPCVIISLNINHLQCAASSVQVK